MLERYLLELDVPAHGEPDLGAALLIEHTGVRGPVVVARQEYEAHREDHPELTRRRRLGTDLPPADALALLEGCHDSQTRIIGLEAYDPREDESGGWRTPCFVYDLSLADDHPADTVRLAARHLRGLRRPGREGRKGPHTFYLRADTTCLDVRTRARLDAGNVSGVACQHVAGRRGAPSR